MNIITIPTTPNYHTCTSSVSFKNVPMVGWGWGGGGGEKGHTCLKGFQATQLVALRGRVGSYYTVYISIGRGGLMGMLRVFRYSPPPPPKFHHYFTQSTHALLLVILHVHTHLSHAVITESRATCNICTTWTPTPLDAQ